jgi:hypothetical protein
MFLTGDFLEAVAVEQQDNFIARWLIVKDGPPARKLEGDSDTGRRVSGRKTKGRLVGGLGN